MKYLITESQYKLLTEGLPLRLKRRLGDLSVFITHAVADFENLCEDFEDEFEYADNVISRAIDDFLTVDESFIDELGDDYDDVHDYLTDYCKNLYGESLFKDYIETCSEQ